MKVGLVFLAIILRTCLVETTRITRIFLDITMFATMLKVYTFLEKVSYTIYVIEIPHGVFPYVFNESKCRNKVITVIRRDFNNLFFFLFSLLNFVLVAHIVVLN